MSGRVTRTTAEWLTFAVSTAVLLAVVVLLGMQLLGSEDPAAPVARQQGQARQAAGRWFVPVDVTNEGDLTASDVQVVAELTVRGEVVDGEQIVDFLAGGETETLLFSFDDDPQNGKLVVRVGGFGKP